MKNLPRPGIIFDMDGTLMDNMGFHRLAWINFLAKYGIDCTEAEFNEKNHGTITEIVPRFFDRPLSREEIAQLGAEKEALYREIYRPYIEALPGLTGFLNELKEQGARMALATAANQANIDFTLEALGVGEYFSAVTGSEEVERGKPDPEVYLVSADKLKIAPENCIAFEDSFSGIQSALAAGMKVVAVATTHSPDELKHFPLVSLIRDYSNFDPENLKI